MKVLITGDVHVKARTSSFPHIDRLKVTLQVLRDMRRLCEIHGVKTVILNGDLIDKAYPELHVLLELRKVLLSFRFAGIQVLWVLGNHEVLLDGDRNTNVMPLFTGPCIPVIGPKKLSGENYELVMIPWYPAERAAKLYKLAAAAVYKSTKRKVLVTHVGLKEGRVAPSNMQISQKLGVEDLYPQAWSRILLSDYHAAQELTPTVRYLGAPIPHTFGDTDNVGVWLLDLDNGALTSLDLLSDYPRFVRWDMASNLGAIPGFKSTDYNEIHCSVVLRDHYVRLYPTAKVICARVNVGDIPAEDGSRFKVQETQDYTSLVNNWMEYTGKVGSEYEAQRTLGIDILKAVH